MGLLDRLFGGGGKKVLPDRVRDLETFRKLVLKSDVPVIVDVWSASCGPCKKLEPVLIEVATRHAGRVRLVEIGTGDADPKLLARLDVRSTPTLIVFDRGEELGRSSGYRPASWFDHMIETEFPARSE
ncbi:MAG: thioredoxin family protein [Myxococcota bacterium]|nr:thioredoxin family protein [Myxococcota bacterium]